MTMPACNMYGTKGGKPLLLAHTGLTRVQNLRFGVDASLQ